ncbi:glycosyltransferase family 2 protein [Proteus mirabilis]|uniref:glycosyltransferase family 2 protein n=1 Tax=Proteus mirabilis TaxID=584 RepID=UPI000F5D41B5|nr:glycosyltransferase [Proteus mirabilis]AZG97116.1 glycosyltransferase family 2 protein [Proteus mirabilis]HBC8711680.1 glycosyltransferase family 2 protein [Proteus mirabilis]
MILSIIVNIKNLEDLVEKCVNSISYSLRNCDPNDYEVLLIDDNSTDRTENILKKYVNQHPSFHYNKVFFNNVGKARKYAIPLCKGDYITFIDGDDFFSDFDMLNIFTILNKEEPDLFITKIQEVFNEKQIIKEQGKIEYRTESKDEIISEFLIHKKFQAHLCSKIFSRKIMLQIEFPEVFCYEDAFFFPEYLILSNKFLYSDNILYNYIKHQGSLSNSLSKEKIELMADVILKMYQVFPNNFHNLISCHAIDHILKYNKELSNSKKNELNKKIKEINPLSFLLDKKIRFSFKKKFLKI